MKKVLFAALLLVCTQVSFSQINKGQWLVGGNVGFNSAKTGDFKSTSFEFSPDAGYFFANQLAGGVRLSFSSEKDDSDEDAATMFTAAPFVRYYILPAAQKVNIFADASYGFGSAKQGDFKQSISGFSIMAGPALFLSPNTALEFAIGYTSMKWEDAEDRTNNIGINVGFQIHLGGGGSAK